MVYINPYDVINAFYVHLDAITYFEIFGTPTIFYKLWQKINRAKTLECPRCGSEGFLSQKTTVSKKKYKYRKWYVRHERIPLPTKTSLRVQKWCYLNKNQLENPKIRDTLKSMKHARDVERCFYLCLRIPT